MSRTASRGRRAVAGAAASAALALAMAVTIGAALRVTHGEGRIPAAPAATDSAGSAPTAATVSYGCPMHPDVRSPAPGRCPLCGMDLLPMGAPGGPPYGVELETSPARVRPGETARLRFHLKDPTTGGAVTALQMVHEKPFHLFIVSDDLETYQHIHPALQDGDVFEVESVLPRAGLYHVFCDFLPVGGTPQVVHRELETQGPQPAATARARRAALRPDAKLERVVDGVRFRLSLEPVLPAAGLPLALQYHLEDAASGAPVTDLEPYLGAWGHTLVLAADATDFVHSHPTRLIAPGSDRAQARGGPDVSFNARLAKPGIHRLWSQFQRGGKVTTVSFTIDVSSAARLAMWDGRRWSAGGAGGAGRADGAGKDASRTSGAAALPAAMGDLDGPVRAIAVRGEDLWAGGEIARAGSVSVSRIARWDGRAWSPLGSGVNGTVRAIAVSGTSVYAGGDFTEAGGAPVSRIARWDGRRWLPLGAGVSRCVDDFCAPTVDAIVIAPDGSIVVGGRFARAGEARAAGIARWDGKTWTPLGAGVRTGERDGEVLALALGRGGRLYAGGRFTNAGDVEARSIAAWDGSRWSALGAGISGGLEKVAALAFARGVLYAGGDFTRAGSADVDRVARWDGTSWSSLGLRTKEPVERIAVSPGSGVVLLGGGAFTLPDGSSTRGVVRWDGAAWRALGPGIGGGPFLAPLQALTVDERGRLYAGGGPFIVSGE